MINENMNDQLPGEKQGNVKHCRIMLTKLRIDVYFYGWNREESFYQVGIVLSVNEQ